MTLLTSVTFSLLLTTAQILAENNSQSSSISKSQNGGNGGQSSHSEISSSSHSEVSGGQGPSLPSIASSQSSVSVTQKCTNGKCYTCVNERCFKGGSYTSVKAIGGCPIAVCTQSCNVQINGPDGCPMCKCNNGTGIREPCDGPADCPKNSAGCRENACAYSNVPNNLPRSCTYAYECPAAENCAKGSCVGLKSGKHLEGHFCTFDYNCPSKYTCQGSTCWDGGEEHLDKVSCVFDFNCPSGYQCRREQQTCYKGGPEHSIYSCVFDNQCEENMRCIDMTCVRL